MVFVACGRPETQPPKPIPEDTLLEPPVQVSPPELTDAVATTVAELRDIAGKGRLRALARRADAEEGFLSNFGGERHLTHWDILRRTGVDPNAKLIELLDEPYALQRVGEETWYVWPDLAAKRPEELIPEKLSFKDRARLNDLVGEVGVEQVRSGSGYPGFRTAMSEDGRWLYFVHEVGE